MADWTLPDLNSPDNPIMQALEQGRQAGYWDYEPYDPRTEPSWDGGDGWSVGTTTVPDQKTPYIGGVPNFFRNLPTQFGNISPVGMAALIRMFSNVTWPTAEVKDYEQKPAEYETTYPEGKETKTLTAEPVTAQTAWLMPDLPSAQSYKRMAAGGALSPFEAYLDLQGEAIKNQFMQQARAAWAPSEQRRPAEWRIPKI